MSNLIVTSPQRPYTFPDKFKAVSNGDVYAGLVDKTDLENPANQIQVYVVGEDGSETPVSQPLKINSGGLLVYNGQPAKFVVKQNYSMLVKQRGKQVFYEANMAFVDPESVAKLASDMQKEVTGIGEIKKASVGMDLHPLINSGVRVDGVGLWIVPNVIADGSPMPNPAILDSLPTSERITVNGGVSVTLKGALSKGSVTSKNSYIPRPLEDRFSDVLNVLDFGAKGDSVTDDTLAIQKALNQKKPIIFPPGRVFLSKKLNVFTGNKLFLNGATIKYTGHLIDNRPRLLVLDGSSEVIVTNGVIDMANSESTIEGGSIGIFGVANNNCAFTHLTIKDFGAKDSLNDEDGVGIFLASNEGVGNLSEFAEGSSTNNLVEHCDLDGPNGDFAIRFYSEFQLTPGHAYKYKTIGCVATNNTIRRIGKSAIELAGPATDGCMATKNTVLYSKIDGMDIDKGACNCIMSNNIIDNVDDGKSSQQYGGITVQSFKNSTENHTARGNVVIGNVINKVKRTGINVAGAVGTVVQGNVVREYGRLGINCQKDSSNDIAGGWSKVDSNSIGIGGSYEGVEITDQYTPISSNQRNTTISNNEIFNATWQAIVTASDAYNTNIIGNNVTCNYGSLTAPAVTRIIYVRGSSTLVTNNKIAFSGNAQSIETIVHVLSAKNVTVTGNQCATLSANTYSNYGFRAQGNSNNLNVSANTFIGVNVGVDFGSASTTIESANLIKSTS